MPRPFNNGLQPDGDDGFGAVSNLPQDNGTFKSPTLRNIEFTAPYMHDGRFTTLEEVVDFYNDGIQNAPNLHPLLREQATGRPLRLNLSSADKAALVAFLKTLTDPTLATDPRFSNPFN